MGNHLVQCDYSWRNESSQSRQLLFNWRWYVHLYLSCTATRNSVFCKYWKECDDWARLQHSQLYYRWWCGDRSGFSYWCRSTHRARCTDFTKLYCSTWKIDSRRSTLGWQYSRIYPWPKREGTYWKLYSQLHERSFRRFDLILTVPKGIRERWSYIRRRKYWRLRREKVLWQPKQQIGLKSKPPTKSSLKRSNFLFYWFERF